MLNNTTVLVEALLSASDRCDEDSIRSLLRRVAAMTPEEERQLTAECLPWHRYVWDEARRNARRLYPNMPQDESINCFPRTRIRA